MVGILAITGLFLLVAATASSKPRKAQRLTSGIWGGPHIRIEVKGDNATIEYDCANGTITGPLKFDRSGRFSWEGAHFREHGGPVRIDETPQSNPATYYGVIKGNTMTLTVKLKGSDEILGEFTLTRGGSGRIFKCR